MVQDSFAATLILAVVAFAGAVSAAEFRADDLTTAKALDLLHETYADEPFVVVSEAGPSTKATLGANTVHLTARVDPRTGWLVVISALDNLVKGASGQAIQNANLMLGLREVAGLPTVGLMP